MAFQSRELYRSAANGDRWSLTRDCQSDRIFIEHEAVQSSGEERTALGGIDLLRVHFETFTHMTRLPSQYSSKAPSDSKPVAQCGLRRRDQC